MSDRPEGESPESFASEPAHESHDHDHHEHDDHRDAAPVGETENPPVPAEVGTPVEQPHAEAGPEHETHASEHEGAERTDAEHPGEFHSSAEGDERPVGDSHGQEIAQENGHDEEEEIVESVGGSDAMEEVAERAPRYRRQYKIQEVIKRRQVMLVQVVKEERGTKGAALTTYLSLAGRYCVLMPNTARGGGISRKITSAEDRKKLREIAEELEVPEGMGVILRTAGAARTKAEVKRDFEYLLRIWSRSAT